MQNRSTQQDKTGEHHGSDFHSADPSSVTFSYEPLDHTKSSIRLLRILPGLSDTGNIQCEMWHDTIDAKYDCLSYVWGSEQNEQDILVNGQTISVRRNLWDFLGTARTKYAVPPRTFWIDALCINQASITEKDHQVAQMGTIYSKAVQVVVWLGFSPGVERALTFWAEVGALNPQTEVEASKLWDSRKEQKPQQFRVDWEELASNQYWSRAWITQEILLARKLSILVNNFEMEPARCSSSGLAYPNVSSIKQASWTEDASWNQNMYLFNTYIQVMCGRKKILGESLVNILHQLPRKGSWLPRDRIYSLRSVASDGARIRIDYGSTDSQVLINLLEVFRRSMCLCFWSYLANILDLDISNDRKDGCGLKIPIFKVLVKPYSYRDKGSDFEAWILGEEETECEEYKLNLRQLCSCVGELEFQLFKYETDDGDRYTIKRDYDIIELDVSRVELKSPPQTSVRGEDGLFHYGAISAPLLNIYLTAEVWLRLFRKTSEFESIPRDRFELCAKAREGKGPLVLDETNLSREILR